MQEAQDLALVAHVAALRARVPFIHFFDGFRTSHEIHSIAQLSDDDLRALVPEDAILDFRARALTPERPVVRGTAQNPDAFFQMREAPNPFYLAVPDVVAAAMEELEQRTGRGYGLVEYAGSPEAERVIVLMGSGLGAAEQTAERVVDAAEAPVRPDDRHAGRRVAEGLGEALGIGLVAPGDVAGDEVAQAGVVVDDGADLGPAHDTVGADDAHAELLVAHAPVGADGLEERADTLDVLGVDDVPQHPGHRPLGVAEQQARGGRVRTADRAVDAAHDERVGGELEQALLEGVPWDVRKVVHRWSSSPGAGRPRVRIGRFAHNS